MKTVAVIAIAPVVGIAALFMCDAVGMVPADSNTRSNYAATVEKDFIQSARRHDSLSNRSRKSFTNVRRALFG